MEKNSLDESGITMSPMSFIRLRFPLSSTDFGYSSIIFALLGLLAMHEPRITDALMDGGYDAQTDKLKIPSKFGIINKWPGLIFRPGQVQNIQDSIRAHELSEKHYGTRAISGPKIVNVSRKNTWGDAAKRIGKGLLWAPASPGRTFGAIHDSVTKLRPGTYTDRGRHYSLAVLGDESNAIVKNFPNTKAQKILTKMRKETGEYELLEHLTGKRFGIDKFTPGDIGKLDRVRTVNVPGLPIVETTKYKSQAAHAAKGRLAKILSKALEGTSRSGRLADLLRRIRR